MLNLFPSWSRTCEGVSRRDFLRIGALTGLGVTLPLALLVPGYAVMMAVFGGLVILTKGSAVAPFLYAIF